MKKFLEKKNWLTVHENHIYELLIILLNKGTLCKFNFGIFLANKKLKNFRHGEDDAFFIEQKYETYYPLKLKTVIFLKCQVFTTNSNIFIAKFELVK